MGPSHGVLEWALYRSQVCSCLRAGPSTISSLDPLSCRHPLEVSGTPSTVVARLKQQRPRRCTAAVRAQCRRAGGTTGFAPLCREQAAIVAKGLKDEASCAAPLEPAARRASGARCARAVARSPSECARCVTRSLTPSESDAILRRRALAKRTRMMCGGIVATASAGVLEKWARRGVVEGWSVAPHSCR